VKPTNCQAPLLYKTKKTIADTFPVEDYRGEMLSDMTAWLSRKLEKHEK
jgi:hypothetical protein